VLALHTKSDILKTTFMAVKQESRGFSINQTFNLKLASISFLEKSVTFVYKAMPVPGLLPYQPLPHRHKMRRPSTHKNNKIAQSHQL